MIPPVRVYFWKCPYLKYAWHSALDFGLTRAGAYCSLGKTEFGQCDQCDVYKKLMFPIDL